MSCPHSTKVTRVAGDPKVFKEECMYCYKTWDEPNWIEVCAVCLQGFCPEHFPIHQLSHPGHSCTVRVSRKTTSVQSSIPDDDADLQSCAKEVKIEAKVDVYDYTFSSYCHSCRQPVDLADDVSLFVKNSIEASKVTSSTWADRPSLECPHIHSIDRQSIDGLKLPDTCSKCDKSDNLWFCLSCGEVGCGRKQYDGSGGNGHAADHFKANPSHTCSVKLGTINSAEPDVFCYVCDDLVYVEGFKEKYLKQILSQVNGNDIKSEKGIREMQWEQNQSFQFSMVTEDGAKLEPAVGYRGISNLGNSCYMASVMQCALRLFHVPAHDPSSCSKEPKDCAHCQLNKLENGLFSMNDEIVELRPWMFKQVITTGHREFASFQQQDAVEFLEFFMKKFALYENVSFDLQQTIKCAECGYETTTQSKPDYLQVPLVEDSNTVDLNDMISSYFKDEFLEGSKCEKCNGQECLKKHFGLVRGPQKCLIVVITRAALKNWVPSKVNTPVTIPSGVNLEGFKEEVKKFIPNEDALNQLMMMGFDRDLCSEALKQTDNDLEAACNALLTGAVKVQSSSVVIDEASLVELLSMGFDEELARRALELTQNNKENACDILLSSPEKLFEVNAGPTDSRCAIEARSEQYELRGVISHKGPSLHCGHYIAHVKDADKWILFNDEKAVLDPSPDFTNAYIAFYEYKK